MTCCDRGYGHPSGRPRVSHPATYRSGAPRVQHPAVARWHSHLHGLTTAIDETSGLVERRSDHVRLRRFIGGFGRVSGDLRCKI